MLPPLSLTNANLAFSSAFPVSANLDGLPGLKTTTTQYDRRFVGISMQGNISLVSCNLFHVVVAL